jgi:hypothetical protein
MKAETVSKELVPSSGFTPEASEQLRNKIYLDAREKEAEVSPLAELGNSRPFQKAN